jgi:hypothetical protein
MSNWIIGITLGLLCIAIFLWRCYRANQETRELEAAAFKSAAERIANDLNQETHWK